MKEAEKQRLKAEAKVIIAMHYCDLFRHYGGVPIVDHAYTANEDMQKERGTVQETLDFIVNLLDEAADEENISLSDKIRIGRELFNSFRKLDVLQELLL